MTLINFYMAFGPQTQINRQTNTPPMLKLPSSEVERNRKEAVGDGIPLPATY